MILKKKYILWNLLGLSLPLIIAAVTIPALLENIGKERFGFLALAWGLIGYASVLDFGIGRAVTQYISSIKDTNSEETLHVLKTAIIITTIISSIFLLLILAISFLEPNLLIKSNSISNAEIKYSLILIAFAFPVQAVSLTYKGVNEAYLNFGKINIIRIFLGIINFAGPFLVSLITTQLYWLVITIVMSRLFAFLFYRKFAFEIIDGQILLKAKNGIYSKNIAKRLFQFGKWVTISNILSPILLQTDRFMIGIIISATAVANYTLSYDIVTQTLVITGAVTSVIFPILSRQISIDNELAKKLFHSWLIKIIVTMILLLCSLAYFYSDLMHFWLDSNLIEKDSIIVGQILCIGIFFNSIGTMYFSLLHAQQETKITALFHIFETLIFIILLPFLITLFGIIGAAIAWSIRTFIDTALLITYYYTQRKVRLPWNI